MKKMLQDEDPPDTLTFAVDCSLNDHYNMNQKVN